jgi:short-subunit dehydrogenase
MVKHKGGQGGAVVNVASVAGLSLKSACPVYDGTNFFVVGYSLSISVSLTDVSSKYVYDVMPLSVNERA